MDVIRNMFYHLEIYNNYKKISFQYEIRWNRFERKENQYEYKFLKNQGPPLVWGKEE